MPVHVALKAAGQIDGLVRQLRFGGKYRALKNQFGAVIVMDG